MALYNICMGISSSNKELSVSRIGCGDTFQIKLSLTAEPDIKTNPTDIVLVLDRSGSMAGSPLANLKNGAKKFIDIIDEATDNQQDGQIGYGSRIGIVSFAQTARQDTPLTTSVAELKNAVDSLSAGGSTNHEDTVEFDAGEIGMESLGRILQLDVTVKNVCPNKRVALAVILTEVDEHGTEYKRGMKTMTIPAHTGSGCHDVMVRCIKFVLPENLDVSGSTDSMCNRRNFKARMIAHYIDDGFACCTIS